MATRFLTTAEVAELVRAPAETVRYWRHVGKGPKSFKVPGGRRVLYAVEDVEVWLADARRSSDAA
jgi:DNA-binding transcriptional MerR regulator